MAENAVSLPLSLQGFSQLPPRSKLVAMAGALALVAALALAWLWAREPEYAVLFSNLSDKDGGAIVAALGQQNVPYRFSAGGGAILVPAGHVHDVRLKLASQGLPKGGLVGFELMEAQKLGISQFAEQVNYQRALEGELSRSIQSLAAVQSARVHLAIPKQSAFLRDEEQPSASVLVSLYAGRTLDAAQAAGIVHLVSASVPRLAAARVSIIDQNGKLLSGPKDTAADGRKLDPEQLDYVRELERGYIDRIESILTPITGAGNVRAQVTAQVDFSRVEQTAETYKPNATPETTTIRSQQTAESQTRDGGPAGVPGALSNQPPAPATAPITAPPAAGTQAQANAAPPLNMRKDATINYEVDKTIKHTREQTGTVKRLSVAIVVNHRKTTSADGKVSHKPLAAAEIKQITDLAREAIGFNGERGDSLNVVNSPFEEATPETATEQPLWKDPAAVGLAKEIGKYLLLGGLTAYLFFGIVRPFARDLAQRARAQAELRELTADDEDGALPQLGHHRPASYEQKLSTARDLAKQDPKLIANVIKDWVGNHER